MKYLETLLKNWKIISTVVALIGSGITAGIHIVKRVDANQELLQTLKNDQKADEKSASDQYAWLDDHEKRMIKLEEDERLREKGLCK